MKTVSKNTAAYAEALLPVRGAEPARANSVMIRTIEQTCSDIHRLIDQQLSAQESSATSTLPTLSQLSSGGQSQHRTVDGRIRKLLAQKLSCGDSVNPNGRATLIPTILRSENSNDDGAVAAYELTMPTPITDADGSVRTVEQKNHQRTRAEVELHLLCESSFRLAAGASHAADPTEVLTLNELVPLRRRRAMRTGAGLSGARKKRVKAGLQSILADNSRALRLWVPVRLSALLLQARQTRRAIIMPLAMPPHMSVPQPIAAGNCNAAAQSMASERRVVRAANRTDMASMPVPRPLQTLTSGSPTTLPATTESRPAAAPNTQRVPRAVPAANIYSAIASTTNMHELVSQLAGTHRSIMISGTDCNCAWRCAWAMVLAHQQPEALEHQLVDMLGDEFRHDAAELKNICNVVQTHGLSAIFSQVGDRGRLVYADNGPEMERLLNRLAIEVMKKNGVAEATAGEFFHPTEMARAEDIQLFVHAMGATSAVMQVESSDNPALTSLALRPKDDAVINGLEIEEGHTIPSARFVQALDSFAVARLANFHFNLLIPDVLWRK